MILKLEKLHQNEASICKAQGKDIPLPACSHINNTMHKKVFFMRNKNQNKFYQRMVATCT